MTPEERELELKMQKYGIFDYVVFIRDFGRYKITNWDSGWYRWRGYHDGGWLEGYAIDPVIYWGA